jgi:ParB family chromosome partitioning protein
MRLQDHLSRITDGLNDIDAKPVRARPGGAVPATSSLAHFSDEMRETRLQLEQLRKAAGRPVRVRLDLCDDGPYHASPLDPGRVDALKEQLAENPQSTPLLLRPKDGGRFEIVAGRHRKAALLALGRDEGDAIVRELSDDETERLVFYDNLFAPSLTDFAKYLGFAQRRRSKDFTLDQLARESGISRSQVARLLAFDRLPQRAVDAVARKPALVGAALAEELAGLVEKHGERVAEAVELVIEGRLKPARAAAWIADVRPAAASATAETVVKHGRTVYAKLQRRGSQVVIRFNSAQEAAALEKDLAEVLRCHAKALKK